MKPTALPPCHQCHGLGTVTVQFRAVHPLDVSPCDSEREVPCRAFGCEDGVLVEAVCSECRDEFDVTPSTHFCAGDTSLPLCEACVRDGDLHTGRCAGERAAEAAEARCEGDR